MKVKVAMAAVVFLALGQFSSAGEDTAKKLVGVWHTTKEDGKAIPEDSVIVLEFTADGKYSTKHVSDTGAAFRQKGTYTVKDESLTLTDKSGDKEISFTVSIKKLTAKELLLVESSRKAKDKRASVEYKRVKN